MGFARAHPSYALIRLLPHAINPLNVRLPDKDRRLSKAPFEKTVVTGLDIGNSVDYDAALSQLNGGAAIPFASVWGDVSRG